MILYFYYNWWTNIDPLLLTEAHSLEFTLCIIQLYRFFPNVLIECHISTIRVSYKIVSLPWKSPAHQSPGTTDFFLTVPVSFLFPGAHILIVGIRKHAEFSDWLLSLSSIYSEFIHVLPWLDSLFLFNPWIILDCMDIPEFVLCIPFTFWRTSQLLQLWIKLQETFMCKIFFFLVQYAFSLFLNSTI